MATNAIGAKKCTLQYNNSLSAAISGTRTSDTVFTRSAGTWTIDAQIGAYCQSYVAASPNTYAWDKIIDNDTTTLTIDGTLLAAADTVKLGGVISEVMSLSGARNRNTIDVLSCDSTNQAIERIKGALDEGEISLTLVYDGSDSGVYNTLNTDFLAGTKGTATLRYQGVSDISGTAIITALGTPMFGSADDIVTLDLTLRWSGKNTYTDVP